MTTKAIQFTIETYASSIELNSNDAALLDAARNVTKAAYAPYSNFLVGAVADLVSGQQVSGTNQENASYPVGICAERVLLSTISSLFPGAAIKTIAISYHNLKGQSNHPISPCGICRQTLVEYQNRTGSPIRLILSGMEGEVIIVESADQLLPLSFTSIDLLG
ncbi:MAG: cytidine deaminase [Ferruginibacter sp.]